MWRDLLHVDASYSLSAIPLIGRSILVVGGIFFCCSMIDMLRIRWIERPVFEHFDPVEQAILRVWKDFKKATRAAYNAVM